MANYLMMNTINFLDMDPDALIILRFGVGPQDGFDSHFDKRAVRSYRLRNEGRQRAVFKAKYFK